MLLSLTGVLEDGSAPRGTYVPLNPRKTLSMPLGSSVTLAVRILRANGQVVTTGTAIFTVKKNARDFTAAFTKSGTPADPLQLTIAPSDTKNLEPGLFVYDVFHVDGSGDRNAVVPLSTLLIEAVSSRPA